MLSTIPIDLKEIDKKTLIKRSCELALLLSLMQSIFTNRWLFSLKMKLLKLTY